jgi:hypothetical protein
MHQDSHLEQIALCRRIAGIALQRLAAPDDLKLSEKVAQLGGVLRLRYWR